MSSANMQSSTFISFVMSEKIATLKLFVSPDTQPARFTTFMRVKSLLLGVMCVQLKYAMEDIILNVHANTQTVATEDY